MVNEYRILDARVSEIGYQRGDNIGQFLQRPNQTKPNTCWTKLNLTDNKSELFWPNATQDRRYQ